MARLLGFVALFFALMLMPAGGAAQDKASPKAGVVEAAQNATENWLTQVDYGKYGESWDQASKFFQSRLTRQQWIQALDKVRTPLGQVQSRKLKSATYTTDVPNAPAGEYVIIQYRTSFQNMNEAIETVTPMLEKDGTWKVSGYFIKPAQ